MTFNVWTFLFEVLNFLVLAYVLHRLLYRPLRAAIDKRQAENEAARKEAEAARREAEAARAELAAKLAAADRDRQDLLRRAAGEAEAEKARRLAAADAAAAAVREEAGREAGRLRRDTLAGLETEVGEMAVGLAERLLSQACGASLDARLTRRLADAVRAVGGEERERVRRDAGADGAVVEAAAPPDPAALADLAAALRDLVGQACEVKVEVSRLWSAGRLPGWAGTSGTRRWRPNSPRPGPPSRGGIMEPPADTGSRGSVSPSGGRQPPEKASPQGADAPRSGIPTPVTGDESLAGRVRGRLDTVGWEVRRREVGHVVRVGDGVAYLRGMPSVKYGELLECGGGLPALAFDLRPDQVGALFLGPADRVAAGDEVRLTGRVASVPVGGGLLGRVIDPLGAPLDGLGPLRAEAVWPVERAAPGVADREPVTEPLLTGTKVIDALLPIGRGQRELILGDRATGKTTIALDAILAQRGTGVTCVYASVGERKAALAEVVDALAAEGALAYTAVVAADADAAPGLQYLAPFAACTVGEYFMARGGHVLVVYDDLTKHADAYRRVCLLLGRPPGREAYPADVFYLHARLLERATRLHARLGGGSLTALPVATTQAGNVAAYIPTNLISITDGQIYLDTRLFNEGQRPAVDVGLSVSRVGGKAQPPGLRQVVGDLKLLYSQLPELESFTRFGAELEPETRRRLGRGLRLREAFKQRPHRPRRLGLLAADLFAVREGLLDAVPVERIDEFLAALARRLTESEPGLLEAVERPGPMPPETEGRLRAAVTAERDALPAAGGGAP